MGWQNKTISPGWDVPPKMHLRYPCPGLCRFAGTLSFLLVGLGVYYGGMKVLSLEPLDWAAPVWTARHVGLVVAGVLLGMLAGLIGFARAMTLEVRSERLNHLFIVLWQFLANGSMLWVLTIGVAMSVSLGRAEAKTAVLQFGAERATIHAVGTGAGVGLLLGIASLFAGILRVRLIGYLAFAVTIALSAARWHFCVYGIEGKSWMIAGIATPILLLVVTPSMIERDHRQRRLAMEQAP